MNRPRNTGRPSKVPAHRLSRLAGFGRLTAGVATQSMIEGVRRLGRGEIPTTADLFLTPANIMKVADELARMRGAALKLGQLLSMDAGEFLPRELADLMERLRADADFMPNAQLIGVLEDNWGPRWKDQFDDFEMRPIAAASIGQVHRATTLDGRRLAIKVQYPGVARSINSDVDNVVSLFQLTGFAPPKVRLDPLIAEAKHQLSQEADYTIEAANIDRFRSAVPLDSAFVLPEVQHDLSTNRVLAMSFVPGVPIDATEGLDQEARNRIVMLLTQLSVQEVLRFGFAQTDPNFANYTYDTQSGKIGLLDFGAVRAFSGKTRSLYRQFLLAGLDGDRNMLRELALKMGLYRKETSAKHRGLIDRMIAYVFGSVRREDLFDFSDDRLLQDLRAIGMELALDQRFDEVPPVDVLYLQRKVAGLYLLGRRLRAVVPLQAMLRKEIETLSAGLEGANEWDR